MSVRRISQRLIEDGHLQEEMFCCLNILVYCEERLHLDISNIHLISTFAKNNNILVRITILISDNCYSTEIKKAKIDYFTLHLIFEDQSCWKARRSERRNF